MKTIFWDTDTLNDFMNEGGALYVPGAEDIKPNLKRVTNLAERYDIPIVHAADRHDESSKEISDTPDMATTFPRHCMEGTAGAEFIAETSPRRPVYDCDWKNNRYNPAEVVNKKDIVIRKDEFNVHTGNPHTSAILSALSPDRIVTYGVATNVCDDFAVMGFLRNGYEVYFVEDAMAGLPGAPVTTLPSPEETMAKWEKLGAKRITTADLEDLLR